MELTILGFMGGYPSKGMGTSSYLLESEGFHLLIDVGSNAILALEEQIDPLDIDAVILTHYHPDHIADLGVLQHVFLLKENPNQKEKKVLPVYGHVESDLQKLRTHPNVTVAVDYSGNEKIEIGPFHRKSQPRKLGILMPRGMGELSDLFTSFLVSFPFTFNRVVL